MIHNHHKLQKPAKDRMSPKHNFEFYLREIVEEHNFCPGCGAVFTPVFCPDCRTFQCKYCNYPHIRFPVPQRAAEQFRREKPLNGALWDLDKAK